MIANRLDPWHGAWFHPYSFTHLDVVHSPDQTDDRFLVDVTFRVTPLASMAHAPGPGARSDLPVGVAILARWLTIATGWLHTALGLAIVVLAVAHLHTRPVRWRWLTTRSRTMRRHAHRALTVALLASAAAMLVTGVLRMTGIPAAASGHAIASYLFLVIATAHVIWLLPRLRRRLASRSHVPRTGHRPSDRPMNVNGTGPVRLICRCWRH